MLSSWYFGINAVAQGSCLDQGNSSKHVFLLSQPYCTKKTPTDLSLWPIRALNKPQVRETVLALEKPILLLPLSWRDRLGFVSLRRHKKTQPSVLPHARASQGRETLVTPGTTALWLSSALKRLKEELCASHAAQLAAPLGAAVISYPAEWEVSVTASLTHFQEAVWQGREVFANTKILRREMHKWRHH